MTPGFFAHRLRKYENPARKASTLEANIFFNFKAQQHNSGPREPHPWGLLVLGTALKDPSVLCRKCGPEKLTYLTIAEVNLFGKHSSRIGFRSKILVKNLKHHLMTKFEGKKSTTSLIILGGKIRTICEWLRVEKLNLCWQRHLADRYGNHVSDAIWWPSLKKVHLMATFASAALVSRLAEELETLRSVLPRW